MYVLVQVSLTMALLDERHSHAFSLCRAQTAVKQHANSVIEPAVAQVAATPIYYLNSLQYYG